MDAKEALRVVERTTNYYCTFKCSRDDCKHCNLYIALLTLADYVNEEQEE